MHGTLKSRMKRIRSKSRVSLESAIDQVLYDIRSSPSDITGETPYFRLFGRPMSTKLSRVNDCSNAPVMRKRFVKAEYAKRWSSVDKNYQPGEHVLVRKGDGHAFEYRGLVKRKLGKYTYLICLNGRDVKYNQRNLKPFKGVWMESDCDDAAKAYDDVASSHSIVSPNLQPRFSRYPSRVRRPPQFYGERVFR